MPQNSGFNFGSLLSSVSALSTALHTHAQSTLSTSSSSSSSLSPTAGLFLLQDLINLIVLGTNPGSSITSASGVVADIARLGNRVCRFVVDDGGPAIGTGFLISPCHAITAGHLFFDRNDNLIDPNRRGRLVAEFQTIHVGQLIISGDISTAKVDSIVLPHKDFGQPSHRVSEIDFAVVKLSRPVGDDVITWGVPRGFFTIPIPAAAPVLVPGLVVRTLQYIDRGELRTSSGRIVQIRDNPRRFLYDASTLDASSGSPIIDDRLRLVGVHLGGSLDPDFRSANRALPIRQVARVLSSTPGIQEKLDACR